MVTEPLTFNSGLVNAFPALSNATLSTRAGVVLGGPVRENSAGPYTELNPQEVGPVTGAIAVVNNLSGTELERGEYMDAGMDALVTPQEFQSTGINLTIFVSYSSATESTGSVRSQG